MSKMEHKQGELLSLKDVKGHETNPFMVDLKGKMFLQPRANTIIAKEQGIIDKETGELLSDRVLVGKRKIVDKSQFAKIYASEIGIFYNLSKAGIMVFMYLSKVMDFDNKSIFDYQKQYDKIGYKSHKQALQGIRELISQNIIAPHIISGLWWMNPSIVCKGERFAKYTEYLTQEEADREANMLLKQQGKRAMDLLPESVQDKYKYGSSKESVSSDNYHPNQSFFDFGEENPYKKERNG